jgi:fucose 4-O-acetylase-like acetyltransferase
MLPFLFTIFLIYFANSLFSKMDLLIAFKRMIKAYLYAGGWYLEWIQLWFLPHLFVLSIFAYLMLKLIGNSYIRLTILAAGLAISQSILIYFWPVHLTISGTSYYFSGLPFSLDLILICSFFFLLGNEINRLDYQKWTHNIPFLVLSFFALIAFNYFSNARLDLFLRVFDSLWINVAEAVLGIFFVLALSVQLEQYTSRLASLLIYIGQRSLFILIFHFSIQGILLVKFLALTGNVIASAWGAFVASVMISIFIYEVFVKPNATVSFLFGGRTKTVNSVALSSDVSFASHSD